MQPSVQPSRLTGGTASPSAAIPPPEPKSQSSAAPSVPNSATPKDQGRVPAQGGIPGRVSGKPLPNAAIEPAVKADTEELAKDRETALKGQQDMATIRAVQDFAPKVKTGWSADTKLEGARILKSIGVPDDKIKDFLKTDVAAGQILQKKFVELSAAAARTMGAREPGSVIQMFAKAYPNLGTDPDAINLQTNALYMDRFDRSILPIRKPTISTTASTVCSRRGNIAALRASTRRSTSRTRRNPICTRPKRCPALAAVEADQGRRPAAADYRSHSARFTVHGAGRKDARQARRGRPAIGHAHADAEWMTYPGGRDGSGRRR